MLVVLFQGILIFQRLEYIGGGQSQLLVAVGRLNHNKFLFIQIGANIFKGIFKGVLFHLLIEWLNLLLESFYFLNIILLILLDLGDIQFHFIDEFLQFLNGSLFLF